MATRKPVRSKLHVKKGDKVVVISGAYASQEPREVLRVHPEEGRVVVQGVNLRWKHQRRTQQSPQGGRTQREFPIYASKVMLWSAAAQKGVRTRVEVIEGKKTRVGVACGTRFD